MKMKIDIDPVSDEPQTSSGKAPQIDLPRMPLQPPLHRKKYSVAEKREILRQFDACPNGGKSKLLCGMGLHFSSIAVWRKQIAAQDDVALAPKKRGRTSNQLESLTAEIKQLKKDKSELRRQFNLLLEDAKEIANHYVNGGRLRRRLRVLVFQKWEIARRGE